MTTFGSDPELPPSVASEVFALQDRARTLAEEMVRHATSAAHKGQAVGTFIVEVADCIDSIDHRTAMKMGGVGEIQDFAQQLRVSAREFADQFPVED